MIPYSTTAVAKHETERWQSSPQLATRHPRVTYWYPTTPTGWRMRRVVPERDQVRKSLILLAPVTGRCTTECDPHKFATCA